MLPAPRVHQVQPGPLSPQRLSLGASLSRGIPGMRWKQRCRTAMLQGEPGCGRCSTKITGTHTPATGAARLKPLRPLSPLPPSPSPLQKGLSGLRAAARPRSLQPYRSAAGPQPAPPRARLRHRPANATGPGPPPRVGGRLGAAAGASTGGQGRAGLLTPAPGARSRLLPSAGLVLRWNAKNRAAAGPAAFPSRSEAPKLAAFTLRCLPPR